ncbi:MAG: NrfD/PsrC family molybdoenzyme membrane anchor subunit [Candidatus Thorarchaeota archaeon]
MINQNRLETKKYQNLIDSTKTSRKFWIFVAFLLIFVIIGIVAIINQLITGLHVTGMSNRVFMGLYIVNFVFFIGISHAGTLISAILRVGNVKWRTPITRMAETITVFALIIGASMVLIDMGRLDRVFNLIFYGRIASPLVWDFLSLTTYLVGSVTFLYLPLIPDFAILRDRNRSLNNRRYKAYRILAVNWQGTSEQEKKLKRGMGIMAFLIIPVAVSVHTVISWIFSMTWRPYWHSTIFGPDFVVGAIYSGIAAIILAMAIFRKLYKLEGFITEKHFKNLAYLMMLFGMILLYFTISEYLTSGYTHWTDDATLLHQLYFGWFAWLFWGFMFTTFFIPLAILFFPKTRHVKGIVFSAFVVVIGMWLERYLIVVPVVSLGPVDLTWVLYVPTITEILITVAAVALFLLFYTVTSKIFPIVCMWEMIEHEEEEGLQTTEPSPISEKMPHVPDGVIVGSD